MSDKLPPFQFALAVFALTPFCVAFVVVVALGVLVIWPVLPFIAYHQRKEEREDLERQLKQCGTPTISPESSPQ